MIRRRGDALPGPFQQLQCPLPRVLALRIVPLRAEVAATVGDPAQLDSELRFLLGVLDGPDSAASNS